MKPLLSSSLERQIKVIGSRPRGSHIFFGVEGVGKFTTAIWLAKLLNCAGSGDDNCQSCSLIDHRNHPDLLVVEPDGKSLGIEQIGDLLQKLELLPYGSGQRVVVIDRAELLTTEAQNRLLKTIEEPPQKTTIVLIASELETLLLTVQSRSQILFFAPLSQPDLAAYLVRELDFKPQEAKELAELSGGAVGRARRFSQSPEAKQRHAALRDAAAAFLKSERFERLLIASKLASETVSHGEIIDAISGLVRQQLRRQDSESDLVHFASQLSAIERFARYRRSNVPLKAALESLCLEL